MAEDVYSRLSTAPVSVAHLVRELRSRWGVEHGVGEVHSFVCEALYCLLSHDDIETGEMTVGRFVSWKLEPWDAYDRIDDELMALDTFLDDDGKYVFRRGPAA